MLGRAFLVACVFLCSTDVVFNTSAAFAVQKTNNGNSKTSSEKLPLEELRLFTEVMQHIKSVYVEEVSDSLLLEYAIRGMLNGLDPHSAYLEPDDFKTLEESTSGEFGGLGIEVSMIDGLIKVIAPIDDSPASKAGIKAGDFIIKLNNKQVKGMSLKQAVEHMRGKIGTSIRLTVIREGVTAPLEFKIARNTVKIHSVKSRIIENGFGYIRISQFQVNTAKELSKSFKILKSQSNGQLKGIVLDLRNNPGGVLQAAVDVTDAFLDQGLIVYTQGRQSSNDMRYSASPYNPSGKIPLVIIINEGSASASEIVAGALQDHKRAVLVGSRSFGKGSVQTVLPLAADNKRALKLTTARYYTPSGRSIQAEGIRPDIILRKVQLSELEERESYRESTLTGHLKNRQKNRNKTNKSASDSLTANDYPLSQAINILKGMWALTQDSDKQKNKANK